MVECVDLSCLFGGEACVVYIYYRVAPINEHHDPSSQRKLMARSDRVKCLDLHSKESWMLACLYNGNVHIWNYESQVSRIHPPFLICPFLLHSPILRVHVMIVKGDRNKIVCLLRILV